MKILITSGGTKIPIDRVRSITNMSRGTFGSRIADAFFDEGLEAFRTGSVAMLHLKLRTETCHLDGWQLDGNRDKRLLDPTPYLKSKDIILT